jgi:hypothetical protein
MSIGKQDGEVPPSPVESGHEWRVSVAVSVLAIVPNEVLRPWLAIEAFARNRPECWPGNKALMPMMGVGSARVVRSILERLEDHGILQRRQLPGNRRILALVRRTASELSPTEWTAMSDQARRRAEGRVAVAKSKAANRKVHRPKIRIVG